MSFFKMNKFKLFFFISTFCYAIQAMDPEPELFWEDQDLLFKGAKNNDIRMIVEALSKRAKINFIDCDLRYHNNEEDTALMAASRNKSIEAVDILIKNGADVDIVNCNGDTALSYAALKGSLAIVELLINNGASLWPENNFMNHTAWGWAEWLGHKEVQTFLEQMKEKKEELIRKSTDPYLPKDLVDIVLEYGI